MSQQPVHITTRGIKNALRRYKLERAICEFIWNGYDAGATSIGVQTVANPFDFITEIVVCDNGSGIDHDTLDQTFMPLFESTKVFQDRARKKKRSVSHGKNGVGRLTFFRFATDAKWTTTYRDNSGSTYRYSIQVNQGTLNEFSSDTPVAVDGDSGTSVRFSQILSIDKFQFETNILPYIKRQFAWYLHLHSHRAYTLTIDGEVLTYDDLIGEMATSTFQSKTSNFDFNIDYVRWSQKPEGELSHYYYIGQNGLERAKETTALNRKGDGFYHSVYVLSRFFDTVDVDDLQMRPDHLGQTSFVEDHDAVYTELRKHLDSMLAIKRKQFLSESTDTLIKSFESKGVFPVSSGDEWDEIRGTELRNVIRELYQVEPKLFVRLNEEQKKTFVRLLNLALESGERQSLFSVLKEITGLDKAELYDLAELLTRTRLSNIVKTIRLINDRYEAVAALKQLVFDKGLNAYEHHVQELIEEHYWLFGEEYHLVTAAEPDFEEALRRYRFLKEGNVSDVHIAHDDRRKEMDIFAVRWLYGADHIDCIVVELKRPKVKLGQVQLDQLKKYMAVIRAADEFKDRSMRWRFYLVGNDFDTSGYIEGEIESNLNHGETSLVHARDAKQFRVYVKTWSEIFNEFERRHRFLQERLELAREKLLLPASSATGLIEAQAANTAARPGEPVVPPYPKGR